MVWVNLLPWRQTRQLRRWRLWRLNAVLLLLVLALLLLNGQWQRQLNHAQAATLAQWQAAQRAAEALNKRWQDAQQQSLQVQQLRDRHLQRQQQLAAWAAFARTLGALFPADTWLTALHKSPQSLTMNGQGRSIHHLHQLRDRLAETPLLGQVTLGAMQRTRTGDITFEILAELAVPDEPPP